VRHWAGYSCTARNLTCDVTQWSVVFGLQSDEELGTLKDGGEV